ncbi:MAG: rhodanese-like domain-containing protein [Lachnoclostridium sp.]|jgi:rhodanese-related sulfurtransferase|nr:rhodanese-like domain-containing protein [Lachnoclostridium sp.]
MRLLVIPPRELPMYLGDDRVGIVDLRDRSDFEKSHINKAISIPYEEIEYHYNELRKYHMLILYCSRGNRSLIAARCMEREGFLCGSIAGGYEAYRMEQRRRCSFD